MTEPIKDYAEPVIKMGKGVKRLEDLLRKRDFEGAMEELPGIELQVQRVRNFLYREAEK